ncbi:MAG: DNA polymerase III subunit delta' [Dehalococcoidia bacterium]
MWRVIGQDKILSLLDYGLKTNAIAHAYLLIGPRHVGKGTLAINLAQALNCDALEVPCGECRSCQRILEGKHADVTVTRVDSRTEIGIDDVKELQRLANLPPYEGKCKVFIIEDAEYLSAEAANRLLKILEEPPPGVVWLLLAADQERLLPTIISRCQRLELKPLSTERMQEILINSHNVEADKAKLLARLSHGRLGWALSALANDEILEKRSQKIAELVSLSNAGLEQRFGYAQEVANLFSQNRRDAVEIVEIWLDWWRDLMLIKAGCQDAIINFDYESTLKEQCRGLDLREIEDFLAKLCLLEERIFQNVNPRLAWEWLMLNLPGKRLRMKS